MNPSSREARHLAPDDEVSFVPMEAVGERGGLDLVATRPAADFAGTYTYFRDDDVVVAKITPCFENGKGAHAKGLVNGAAIGTTELHVLRPHSTALDPRFLFYLSISQPFRALGEASMYGAGGQKRVPDTFIKDFRAPLPPIDEQRAIAAFLDRETARIDALVAAKRRLIALLQEKRAALIARAVTRGLDPAAPTKDSGVAWLGRVPAHWDVMKIKRRTRVKRGASPRPIDDPIYFDDAGEYSWVRISDVTASEKHLEQSEQTLSTLGASLSVKLEPGAMFLSIAATVGKPIITKLKCCIHDGFVYFPDLPDSSDFLYYVFASGEPYRGLGKMGTQLNLNTDTVADIEVAWPPPVEQHAIAGFLDAQTSKIAASTAAVESAIARLTEYRSTLITSAVTGRIDVRAAA